MTSQDLVALIHLAGFVTGAVLYAMLAAMTLRRGVVPPSMEGSHGRFPLTAAALGLAWNAIALVVYATRDFGFGQPNPWLVAIGFVALGFLPAVVVQSTVVPRFMGRASRVLVPVAYGLSAVGGSLQFAAAMRDEVPSRAGLLTLSAGYAAILVVLVALGPRDRRAWRRSLFVIALAAFSLSALHLSQPELAPDSWAVALLGHQASLPLVLVILYQDYRFAFADLFLRRALSLLALVAVAVVLHVAVAAPLVPRRVGSAHSALSATIVQIALWVLTALAYPAMRRGVGRFVDGIVLGRADYGHLRTRVNGRILEAASAESVLGHACEALASGLDARSVAWQLDEDATPVARPELVIRRESRGVRVAVPTTDAPRYSLDVGDLAPGRRLLSDDVALMEWVAVVAARRIDLIRLTRERYERDLREHEILQLATEAELRELRAQLNPHFLFNALTTIGHLLQTAPDRALDTLYQLTSLLRFVLRRSAGGFVTLGEELELVDAYLAIERARFEERLSTTIDIDDALRTLRIPPLLLQPLVENAIKHGIAPVAHGGHLLLFARLEMSARGAAADSVLHLAVEDDGVGLGRSSSAQQPGDGVGLENIAQRLARYYGDAAGIRIATRTGGGTRVALWLPVDLRSNLAPAAPQLGMDSRTGAVPEGSDGYRVPALPTHR